MPEWDNYGVSKSDFDKGDFTRSTDSTVRNLATGKTGVSASELAAINAKEKAAKEKAKKEKEIKAHKTWITNTKEKKKKKKDWVKKTLTTVDNADKLYRFGKTLNPINLYKSNPYIMGGSLLKGIYDKNKKSKDKEKVSLVDLETPFQVAELTESQKNWIDKELNNLKQGFKEPQHVFETINNPALGKFEKNTLNPFKGPQEPTTPKEFMDYLKEKAPNSTFTTVTAVGADGGVARKKYNQGSNGILDIEDEESEDISLTAFNPNFDQIPQLTEEEQLRIDSEEKEDGEKRIDLFSKTEEGDPLNKLLMAEDGISTLFRAKNGGNASKNIKGQPHMLAYITPGEAKTLENLGGQKTMTKEGIPAYPPSENYGGSWGGSSNDFSGTDSGGWDPGVTSNYDAGMTTTTTDNQGSDHSHSRFDVGSGYYGEPVTGTVENISGGDIWDWDDTSEVDDVIETYNNVKDRYERNKTKQNWKMVANVLTGSIFGAAKTAYGMNKDKKAYEDMLGKLKADALELGIPAYSPHTDTLVQTINQELIDINKKPKEKEDEGPDGDAYPVAPIHQEIQEYEQMAWDPMSYLDQIRSKQAQRASLVEKGIIQDNQTMTLNSGGLANLFRVKNY